MNRPAYSPRELAAFELLAQTDGRAAAALINRNTANAADLARADAALAAARAADAASNDGYGNRFSWAFEDWSAEQVPSGKQLVQMERRARNPQTMGMLELVDGITRAAERETAAQS